MNYYYLSVLFLLFLHQAALGNGTSGLCKHDAKLQADTTVFTVVESPAEFPGGIGGLRGFIRSKSKIPIASKIGKRTVTIGLKLLVERDGRISAVEIIRMDGVEGRKQEKYEREARRIISEMPRWKPGSQSGKRLRTYALVPIHFVKTF